MAIALTDVKVRIYIFLTRPADNCDTLRSYKTFCQTLSI